MGRKLTESQKAERAAKAIEKKHRDELGPLFEAQAPVVDRHALLMERRRGWANSVEHCEIVAGLAVRQLDLMEVLALERLARQYMPSEDVDCLAAYARRVYPSVGYWHSHWVDILAGKARVATTIRYEDGPPKTITLKGIAGQVNVITIPGGRLIQEDFLPRDGWVSPFPKGWREKQHWWLHEACGLWHAPGQAGCVDPVPVIDGAALDADAEAVLASFARRAA